MVEVDAASSTGCEVELMMPEEVSAAAVGEFVEVVRLPLSST